jgi:hypothetical protein
MQNFSNSQMQMSNRRKKGIRDKIARERRRPENRSSQKQSKTGVLKQAHSKKEAAGPSGQPGERTTREDGALTQALLEPTCVPQKLGYSAAHTPHPPGRDRPTGASPYGQAQPRRSQAVVECGIGSYVMARKTWNPKLGGRTVVMEVPTARQEKGPPRRTRSG